MEKYTKKLYMKPDSMEYPFLRTETAEHLERIATKAMAFLADGRLQEAEPIFTILLNAQPDNITTLYHIGITYLHMEKTSLALLCLEKCLRDKTNKKEQWIPTGEILNNIAIAHKKEERINLAEEYFRKALKVHEHPEDIYANWASCYIDAGDPERGLELANKALEIDPKHGIGGQHKALGLLELKQWREGWKYFDCHQRSDIGLSRNYWAKGFTPRWTGEKGKTVVVHGEQGLGDEIMFGSMLGDAAKDCKKVIFHPHPRIAPIFARSFPGIDVYGGHEETGTEWQSKYQIDARIPVGSLGQFYRNEENDFPQKQYLVADPHKTQQFRNALQRLSSKLKVGITWAGGVKTTKANTRSIPLVEMWPILQQDAEFISLQYTDHAAKEAAHVSGILGKPIYHWQEAIDDLDQLFSLIAAVDLVISVPQTAIHMAGALGQNCWILKPTKSAWRYGGESKHISWYSRNLEMFNQKKGDDWGPVINTVAEKLCELVDTQNSKKPSIKRQTVSLRAS